MEQTPQSDQPSFSAIVASLRSTLRRNLRTERHEDLVRSNDILVDVLVELRRCLNSFAPVDKLPPEILAHIFEEAVRPSGPGDMRKLHNRAAQRMRTRPLLALSHVSSRWRAVALQTPSLWTHVDNHSRAQCRAFLERSQSMPLSLHLLTKDARRVDRLLEEQGHRVRRLDVTEHPRWVHPPAHLQAKLPLLECLTISSECEQVRGDDLGATPILFGERVCNIRAFALRPLYMWIPGNHFPHLTHLYLSTFHGRMLYEDTMRYLTGLFSNTPALEYLYILELQPAAVLTETSTRATLPSLRAFTCVDSDLAATLLLLERVKLPDDVLVRLDALYCHNASPNEDIYLPRPLLSDRFLASFTRLEIVADDTHLHLVAEGARSGLWIAATCIDDALDDPWAPWVAELHRMLPLANLRTLHASVLAPVLLPHHVLAHCPQLAALAVRVHPDFRALDEGPCVGLLSELFWTLGDVEAGTGAGESAQQPLLCPALESVGVEVWGGDPEDFRLPPASDVVPRMAAARAGAGKPLRRLALQPHLERDLGEQLPGLADVFEAALAPIRQHVDVVELVRDAESVVCPLKMSERWKVDAFEEFWEVPEDERPRYRFWGQGGDR